MKVYQELRVDEARGELVGWRVWLQKFYDDGSSSICGHDSLLIYRDGSITPGFRSGIFGSGIDYVPLIVPELKFLGEGI